MEPPSSFLRRRASRTFAFLPYGVQPREPVTQQVGILDRAGLAGQHEEHRLKGVFGMVNVTQELPADVQHHRSVPGHQRGETLSPRSHRALR